MIKKLLILLTLLFIPLVFATSVGFQDSDLTESRVIWTEPEGTIFNNNTASVNNSNFWDLLDVAGDIGTNTIFSFWTANQLDFNETALNDSIDAKINELTIIYNATLISTTVGTLDSGDLNSILKLADGDTYNVSEVTGTPGFDIYVNFTDVIAFNTVALRGRYEGGAGHTLAFELLRTGVGWEEREEITDQMDFGVTTFDVFIGGDFIDAGTVQFRINHDDNGITTHDYFLDAIFIGQVTGIVNGGDLGDLTGRDEPGLLPWAFEKAGGNISGSLSVNHSLNVDNGTICVDEVNHRIGIGNCTPTRKVHIIGAGNDAQAMISETGGSTNVVWSANAVGAFIPFIGTSTSDLFALVANNMQILILGTDGSLHFDRDSVPLYFGRDKDWGIQYRGTGQLRIARLIGSSYVQVLSAMRVGVNDVDVTNINDGGDLSFEGDAGFYPRLLKQATEPANGTGATQIENEEVIMWMDVDDKNKTYFMFNDATNTNIVKTELDLKVANTTLEVSRTATFVVAASDSPDIVKFQADYVCDGVDDEVQINEAIQNLSGATENGRGGGSVVLSEGKFVISNPINIDRGIRLTGQTSQLTEIALADNANCNIIEFEVGHDGNTRALNIVERMTLEGNEGNQIISPVIVTGATGTDASPSVITSVGTYAAFNPNGLAGRKVYLEGVNCNKSLYTIVSNTADTLTLDSNASSGGAMSGLTVEVEPLYGIYQKVGNSAIDIRMIDIWFENIEGGGISLGKYWNHQINKNSFEHLEGAAITLRLTTDDKPESLHIDNNFALDIEGFVKVFGASEAGGIDKVKIANNHISSTEGNIIEIGGLHWIISGNIITADFDTDNTYSIFTGDSNKVDLFRLGGTIISNNYVRPSDGSLAKYVIYMNGTNEIDHVTIANNIFRSVDKNTTIRLETVAQSDLWVITGNDMRSSTGNVIELSNTNVVNVIGNLMIAASGKSEFIWNTNLRNVLFTGNQITRGLTGSYRTASTKPRIENNIGVDETATGTITLQPFQASSIDSSGGAVTATLPDGLVIGQIKTIVMTDATASSTVTVTSHDDVQGIPATGGTPSGDGEVGTFDAVDESWILIWTGTEWTTLRATCTFL